MASIVLRPKTIFTVKNDQSIRHDILQELNLGGNIAAVRTEAEKWRSGSGQVFVLVFRDFLSPIKMRPLQI
jgi:hypothetical protein